MKCDDCDKEMFYLYPIDGKEAWFCKHCKLTVLEEPDPDKEVEEVEVDGDVYDEGDTDF